MKLARALACIFLAVFVGCSVEQGTITSKQAAQYEDLKQDKKNAYAELAAAEAAGDVSAIAAAKTEVERVEEQLAYFEASVLRERAGPVTAILSSMGFGWLTPFVLGLVPLLGKRGRKHAWRALRQLAPWQSDPQAGVHGGIAPIAAVQDLLRYIGVLHSSPASEAAADSNPAATPTI